MTYSFRKFVSIYIDEKVRLHSVLKEIISNRYFNFSLNCEECYKSLWVLMLSLALFTNDRSKIKIQTHEDLL